MLASVVPITTLLGLRKSSRADPSLRNSGLKHMFRQIPSSFPRESMNSCVNPTGTVLFTTTMLSRPLSVRRDSMDSRACVTKDVLQEPSIDSGVPTVTKMTSALSTRLSISYTKCILDEISASNRTSWSPDS